MSGAAATPPVFVDASAWIAAANRRDGHHEAATLAFEACVAQRRRLVTTNWVAYEALSLLKSRGGHSIAADLWSLLSDPAAIDLVRVDQEIEAAAVSMFLDYEDKTWGVVDCASLVVMQRLGCRHALAYDRHFVEASRQYGFSLL